MEGRTLGHFRVERMIGSGGMGAVYEAVDEKLERQVALKVLLQEGDSTPNRKRFLREARLAAKLTHPNIATVYEVGEFENHLYIVMELLEGQALRKLLATQRLRTEQCIGIARDVARALARAHTAGVTHRDIKPENVFITTPTPNVLTAKVLDFGLARQQTARPRVVAGTKNEEHTATEATAPGDILGTPGYWSPEQARSADVDQRTDIFSFGMVLYEMLTGRRAFKANATVALVLAVTRHEPEPVRKLVPGIQPELEALVERCIKKDPSERFADGSELLEAVEEVARIIGRTSPIEIDDATASDDSPAVKPPSLPKPPESNPFAISQTPGPTTRALSAVPIVVPPERVKLFAAIGAGVAGAGLLLIFVAILLGSASDKKKAAAAASLRPPATVTPLPTATASSEEPIAAAVPLAAVAPLPSPAEEPAVEPAVVSTIIPTPLAAPAVSITPTPLAVAASAQPAVVAPPRAHRDKKADCAQPFTIDAKGVKIPKLHCL